jgi:glycogen debranching enzyme
MDLSKNIVLKENYTYFIADPEGQITGGERGLYNRDTRFLSRYQWQFDKPLQLLVSHTPRPDRFEGHYSYIEGPSQLVGVGRTLHITATQLHDALHIENTSLEKQELSLELFFASDFADLFEVRGWHKATRSGIVVTTHKNVAKLEYQSEDHLHFATHLVFSQEPEQFKSNRVSFKLSLMPQEHILLKCDVIIVNPLEPNLPATVNYDEWHNKVNVKLENQHHQGVLEQAITDLRALLLFTEKGLMPAAGIPWYVAAFGRDSLLTAYMMLPYFPEVAEGTLYYLASKQGIKHDIFHAEVPGKILHEVRYGELSRTKKVPFTTYYGTVDATLLFIMLLHKLYQTTADLTIIKELQTHWEAALSWIQSEGDLDGDGFIEFKGSEPGKGLTVQSWKDSHDSLSHANGQLAEGNIAVSEVQGYAYASYLAASEFYALLGNAKESTKYKQKAESLKKAFHDTFWLEDLQTYALALDGNKKPLKVQNSDAGHLLWTGIVPESVAPTLVKTLMSEALWTGWGIRTLGKNEVRYNPVSYHNGSVWPHDTALAASGMMRYGFTEEAKKIREATFDLAASQKDYRLPELIGGYQRSDSPPVPYPVACRPQAWDAAALVYLLSIK